MQQQTTTWVLVSDNSQAKIFRIVKFPKIEPLESIQHPEGHLRTQDLISDAPGRNFQSGGVSRHAYEDSNPRQQEALKFAAHITQHLLTELQKGSFQQLYILATPAFLGMLRQKMDPSLQKAVVAELAKDATGSPTPDIEKHLSTLRF